MAPTVNADAQPLRVVLTAARAATVERMLPRKYAGAMLKPYLHATTPLGPPVPVAILSKSTPAHIASKA